MVSGPASRPAVVSVSRSSKISVTVASAVEAGAGLRSPRVELERGLTFLAVTGEELAHPALGHPVGNRDVSLTAPLDNDSGDDQAGS